MIRPRLRAAGLALLLVSAAPAALAQQASTYPPALPAPLPAIPDAQDVAYPGVIRLDVDATDIDRRLVVGGLVFGAGWGLAGFCPGPALVALGMGVPQAYVFVLAMLVGMGAFEWLEMRKTARSAPHAA